MTSEEKQRIREEVWRKMEMYEIATVPRPCYGRIPNFIGSNAAARKIVLTSAFRKARVVYSTPDLPQKPLREAALARGKVVIMPTPMLMRGFIVLDPDRIPRRKLQVATSLRGAMVYGRRVESLGDIHVDMFIVGSVAAAKDGGRLGKGGGEYDLEYAVLRELGVATEDTVVVTTIHDVQLVERVPMEPHDVPADYIATPTQLIVTNTKYRKPSGIIWDILPIDHISRVPILRKLAGFV